MQFEIIRVRRQGKLIPRWQHGTAPRHRGTLIVSDERDEELNRVCRRAYLLGPGGKQCEGVPPLSDAVLLRATYDTWVISGFERVGSDRGDEIVYAQTWLLTPIDRLRG